MRIVFDKYNIQNERIDTTTSIDEMLYQCFANWNFSYIRATDGMTKEETVISSSEGLAGLISYMNKTGAWRFLFEVLWTPSNTDSLDLSLSNGQNAWVIFTTSFEKAEGMFIDEASKQYANHDIICFKITDFINGTVTVLKSVEELEAYRVSLERAVAWNPTAEEIQKNIQKAAASLATNSISLEELKASVEKFGQVPTIAAGTIEPFTFNSDADKFAKDAEENKKHMQNILTEAGIKLPAESVKTSDSAAIKAAVDPGHYKNYCQGLQWLETMQHLPRFREPALFKAALELIIRGYWDRLGQKDSEEQDLGKALWYTKFMLAYIKNGNKPILIADIDTILNK